MNATKRTAIFLTEAKIKFFALKVDCEKSHIIFNINNESLNKSQKYAENAVAKMIKKAGHEFILISVVELYSGTIAKITIEEK